MSEPLQAKIMRDKQEIGSYPFADLLRLLADGTLKPTDLYWCKGMPSWLKLSQLEEQERAKLKAEADRKVAEALMLRSQQERKSLFQCNTCRAVFKEPSRISPQGGVVFAVVSLVGFFSSAIFVSVLPPVAIMGFALSSLLMGGGFCVFLAGLIREPYCPQCKCSNFSKPE
jgi:GYF domain 2